MSSRRHLRSFCLLLAVPLLLSFAGCREPKGEALDEYESSEVRTRSMDFQVYPGSSFLEEHTEAYRRSHSILNPRSKTIPPMAFYESNDPVETVAGFYAKIYGYERVHPNAVNDFSPYPPHAYLTRGDLAEATRAIVPIIEQLGYDSDISDVSGDFAGAHVDGIDLFPRVSLQRPWYDFISGEVRDTTMILMVQELPEQ
ncbi:MAG: hypothetical protein KY459_13970 [Acidobacteria bacterium]|nr:hypothetical protein [Acidobacteriota bacterium]